MRLYDILKLIHPEPSTRGCVLKNQENPEPMVLHFPPQRMIEAFKAKITRPKFYPGYLGASAVALAAINLADITRALERHVQGDWGDVGDQGWEQNELALQLGERLLSTYQDRCGRRFLVTTEPDHAITWVMLPEEC